MGFHLSGELSSQEIIRPLSFGYFRQPFSSCAARDGRRAKLPDLRVSLLLTALHRFISLTGILAGLLAVSCPTARADDDPLQGTTEEFFSLVRAGAVILENTDGSIHVYGWNEPRVRLVALRKAYTESRLHEIRVEANAQPASLTVRTNIPAESGLFADRSGTVDYTVTVPETAQLKLKLVNGDVTLQGLRGGSAHIELINGRITALNCFARVQARAVNGVLEVFYEWWENLPAAFDYALQHGKIAARLPGNARFAVDAATANGWIHEGFKFHLPTNVGPGQSLKAATAPGGVVSLGLRTGRGNINLEALP
jgi:hypothetical protein